MRMAEGIREGKSVSPDFDVAVQRHQLLDVIQKASDTGIRQMWDSASAQTMAAVLASADYATADSKAGKSVSKSVPQTL
jgi:hypothetical protein